MLANTQTVLPLSRIVFDAGSIEIVGSDIEMLPGGTIFNFRRTGLYHVEWDINVTSEITTQPLVGILEGNLPASGSATATRGNFSSGTLIHVDALPFTISLFNYGSQITISNGAIQDSAASIRIARFADGPN